MARSGPLEEACGLLRAVSSLFDKDMTKIVAC